MVRPCGNHAAYFPIRVSSGLLAVPRQDMSFEGPPLFFCLLAVNSPLGQEAEGATMGNADRRMPGRYGTIGFVVYAVMSLASLLADATVREYGESTTVAPGEARVRDISGFPPAPYVATSPFALSFAPKFEAPGESWDVAFLRLNLLVGSHRAVYALDIGGLGNFADYKMDGIGVAGLFNSVGESDGAIHVAGLFNFAAFDYSGCQISGLYSCTEGSHFGLQVGSANYAGKLTGVQIGLFNSAETLHGIQIGVVNSNKSSPIRFMPIINAAF